MLNPAVSLTCGLVLGLIALIVCIDTIRRLGKGGDPNL